MIKSKGVYVSHLKKMKQNMVKKFRTEIDYNRAVFLIIGYIAGVLITLLILELTKPY